MPAGASLIGFGDDVALVVVNHITEGIERTTNDALIIVDKWIRAN